ncbi:DUF317 domain-containing protein [Streptomyces sp. NPDC093225]|uniref:DUF317 domain-containing protein n=1 Tax=Streptomyces sp. NPDC093225 TaxID=3366034 RepID=UPI003828664A
MEAPLNSRSSRYPSAPDHGLSFWVTPRHLAGDDGLLADRISDTLAESGWMSWTTARSTLLFVSPTGLCGAEWIRTDHAFLLGGLPVAWQISARTHRDSALAEWNAYFTPGTPHEAIADFLLAVEARPEPAVGYAGPEAVLAQLSAMGWPRDFDHPKTTAWDAGLSAGFSWGPLPDGIQDGDPRPDLMGWQAWAEPVLGSPYLWCATFSASTPHDLVGSFAASIASPAPVRRRILPDLSAGRLTFSLPG